MTTLNSRDAVIVEAVRTAVGRRNGSLADTHAVELSAHVLRAIERRTGIDPSVIDDVVWGCVLQVGEQAVNIGRNAVLEADWPETVPATTVDRQCGSSQQAVHFAAAGIVAGHYDVAVAGGVEMMSRIPMGSSVRDLGLGSPNTEHIRKRFEVDRFNQGVGAEMIAERWKLSREELDEFALRSHEKAGRAIDQGFFETEIEPFILQDGSTFSRDEGVRRDTSLERLASLKPAFSEAGVIHAGNSSQISDGAGAVLLMTAERAAALGMRAVARVHTAVVTGSDPVTMLTGPIPATRKALARSGLSIGDIGVYEVNEAFAPVPLAWLADIGADPDRLNPSGGAIALGHPLGGSGARIMTTLLHYMQRQQIEFGLQTMCEGGGQANATILQLLN